MLKWMRLWRLAQKSTQLTLAGLFVSIFSFVYIAVAAPPGSPYNLGETLAPTCAPGALNCTVVPPAASGVNSDITSLQDLDFVGIGASAPTDTEEFLISAPNMPPDDRELLASIQGSMTGASGTFSGIVGLDVVISSAVTGAGGTEAYAYYGGVSSANDADQQLVYGLTQEMETHPTDEGYGIYVWGPNGPTSGGTQYGVYIDLADTDATRYGIYQTSANNNYFAGNIGIGVNTPTAALTVQGTGVTSSQGILVSDTFTDLTDKGAMAIVGARYNNAHKPFAAFGTYDWSGGSQREVFIGGGGWGMPGANVIVFRTAANYDELDDQDLERMRITATGNVGIGTDDPTAKLDITTAASSGTFAMRVGPPETDFSALAQGYAGDARNLFMTKDEGGSYNMLTILQDSAPTGGIVAFQGYVESTNATGTKPTAQAVVADAWHTGAGGLTELFGLGGFAGNNGTGSVTNQRGLKIFSGSNSGGGSVTNNFGIYIEDQSVGTNNYAIYYDSVISSSPFVVMGNGNMGVGTITPNDGKVEVKGGTVCVDTNSDDSATSCITAESDIRLKKNVQPIEGALEKIMQLRGVEFDWRWDEFDQISRYEGKPHDMGVIAQEVEAVFPDALGEDINGYKTVDYRLLVAPLIESVKELKHENDALRATNQQLVDLVCLDHPSAELCK